MGSNDLPDKELDDTKHQIDFLLNQANDLLESVQKNDDDNLNKTPKKNSRLYSEYSL